MPALKDKYLSDVVPKLKEQLGITNRLGVPRVVKVVANMGMGVADKDKIKASVESLSAITGQRPMMTRSRKSISNFKLREGMTIGAKVTLRGNRMYEFLHRLISAALPRIRDFRGLSEKSFDGRGNYTLGVQELTIFPEIDPNNVTVNQGMDITIVTSIPDDRAALTLLKLLGMPFASKQPEGHRIG